MKQVQLHITKACAIIAPVSVLNEPSPMMMPSIVGFFCRRGF